MGNPQSTTKMTKILQPPGSLKIYLPQSLPHQLPVLLSPARFKVAACGRRWGKTDVGLKACVQGHGPRRGALRGAIDGGEIWCVPNPQVRLQSNWSMGRTKKAAPPASGKIAAVAG